MVGALRASETPRKAIIGVGRTANDGMYRILVNLAPAPLRERYGEKHLWSRSTFPPFPRGAFDLLHLTLLAPDFPSVQHLLQRPSLGTRGPVRLNVDDEGV